MVARLPCMLAPQLMRFLCHVLKLQDLLRMRYAHGGMEFSALAETYGASDEAIRKRVKRALDKLQDRLGGEPPVWRSRSRRRSNAEARAEIRNQEESGD